MSCSPSQAGPSPGQSPGMGSASALLQLRFLTEPPALSHPLCWSPVSSWDRNPKNRNLSRRFSSAAPVHGKSTAWAGKQTAPATCLGHFGFFQRI